MVQRSNQRKTGYLNSYLITAMGTVILAIVTAYFIGYRAKTYKEIPYDTPITDETFYKPSQRANWHKIDLGAFALETPVSYLYTKLRGRDSKVGQIANTTDTLFFDYGMFSFTLENFENNEGYESNSYKINGRIFKITRKVDGRGTVGAFTEDLPEAYKLVMICHRCDSAERVVEIFKTIKFLE